MKLCLGSVIPLPYEGTWSLVILFLYQRLYNISLYSVALGAEQRLCDNCDTILLWSRLISFFLVCLFVLPSCWEDQHVESIISYEPWRCHMMDCSVWQTSGLFSFFCHVALNSILNMNINLHTLLVHGLAAPFLPSWGSEVPCEVQFVFILVNVVLKYSKCCDSSH